MQFVAPIPFAEALEKLGSKSIVSSALNSEQWSSVPVALRERAFFSSTIESTRFLQRSRDSISDFLSSAREEITLPDGTKTTMLKTGGRAAFVKQMQDFAISEGMGPVDPLHAGTVRDIRTEKRLGLIFDTQTRQAQDFGNWKQGMDPDVLNAYPAQRFVRERPVKEPRDNHRFHEGQVELKSNLEFWTALNRDFHVPWGPWGWGCGHDVEDVDRAEAERRSLIAPGQLAKPVEKDFNARLEASTSNLDPDLVEPIKKAFAHHPEFSLQGNSIIWTQRKIAKPTPAKEAPLQHGPSGQNETMPTDKTTPSPSPSLLKAYEDGKAQGKRWDHNLSRFSSAAGYGDADLPPYYDDIGDPRALFWESGFLGNDIPKWVRARRIGELPKNKVSFNFQEQKLEPGVSVLHLEGEEEKHKGTYEMFNPGKSQWVEGWLHYKHGADNEPLLVGAVKSKKTD